MEEKDFERFFKGSFLSKNFFIFHFFVLIFAISLIIIGNWELGLFIIVMATLIAYLSYRLAGGKQNPIIWEDKDLYILLRDALSTGKAKIGFHSFRDQKILLNKIEEIGMINRSHITNRHFIRDIILKNQKAFDVLRDDIIIQMIHNGKQKCWDGYGHKKDLQYFHKAEIIIDVESRANYMFLNVLDGLRNNDLEVNNT